MRRFVKIRQVTKEKKIGDQKIPVVSVFPVYFTTSPDLMKKGGKFYAILDHETGMWSTNETDLIWFVDREVQNFLDAHYICDENGYYHDSMNRTVDPEFLCDSSTGRLLEFKRWFNNLPENYNYVQLDTELTGRDETVTPEMYRSKRLSYEIKEGSIEAYDRLMSVLYSEDDRRKIEWSIGSIYTGFSKKIEKILVLYGKPGSGKSTLLDLIKELFDGYWSAFVASELVSKSHQFATAFFKDNPLLAIQDDGSMSKIDSPVINEIVSHKDVVINEKGKSQYTIRANTFLILATNEKIDVQDRRKGIARRLLDVYSSGNKIQEDEFDSLVSRLKFEYGAIAAHCVKVFKEYGKNYYLHYIPEKMINLTSDIQNFLFDKCESLSRNEYSTRSNLYKMFKEYCEDCGINYPMKITDFGEQVQDYFEEYYKFKRFNGENVHHAFVGLKLGMLMGDVDNHTEKKDSVAHWLKFDCTESLLDKLYSGCIAQYAKEDGSPKNYWSKVTTTLSMLDTRRLHWVKLPSNVIRIDFDLKGPDGKKNLELNIKAASQFQPTYAEVSRSGGGIHLYYIWNGDVDSLSSVYDENIEIKKPNQPDRRILTKCNDIPIATIDTGLPLKVVKEKIEDFKPSESAIRTTIKRCLAKEIHGDTTSNVDWIHEILERAYVSGIKYDVSDMADQIMEFARHSSNQSTKCMNKVKTMKFKSANVEGNEKGGLPVISSDTVELENEIRNYIREKLLTKDKKARETIDMIHDLLKRAYESGYAYDVSDFRQSLVIFAIDAGQPDNEYCLEKISEMKFSSEDPSKRLEDSEEAPIIFFDCEVFPNLIVICWKYAGPDNKVMKMINPTSEMIRKLTEARLIGFNNKDYDNHILYAIMAGYSTKEVYNISKAIISGEKSAKFREAKNLSYTDIFDFSSKKQSLKDWEIEMGIHHQELGLPWDEPVDPSLWDTVADYCTNDVVATEALFYHLKQDWMARQILADLANSNVNESTNNLTLKIVFGNDRKPTLVYTNLATGAQSEGR